MIFDCMDERGFAMITERWSDEYELCHFPVFDFLHPLPVHWMVIVYLTMALGGQCIYLQDFPVSFAQ